MKYKVNFNYILGTEYEIMALVLDVKSLISIKRLTDRKEHQNILNPMPLSCKLRLKLTFNSSNDMNTVANFITTTSVFKKQLERGIMESY